MTTAVFLQIITGLLGIIALWLRDYYSQDKTEQRKEDKANDVKQDIRKAVVSGDVNTVQCELDRLLSVELHSSSSGCKGSEDQRG